MRKPAVSRDRRISTSGTDDADSEADLLADEFDTGAAYKQYKGRRTHNRKRVAAETNRIRAAKKSKASAVSSIVGRKAPPKKDTGYGPTGFTTDSLGDDAGPTPTFLDDPIPDYIISRQRSLKNLHEAGLRCPPSYRQVDWSDIADTEEKPLLHKDVLPQLEK